MSEENVEIVRRLYAKWRDDAFVEPDEEVLELLDDEIEWDVSRRTFDPGVYHGHAGVKQFAANLREVWESGRIEPLEFIRGEDEIVVPVRLRFVSKTHGQAMTANAAHVWTLRDGKIVRHRVFQTKTEALEAAGLPE
jgi:ketosteroid isomerase-like protein